MRRPAPPIAIRAPPPYIRGYCSADDLVPTWFAYFSRLAQQAGSSPQCRPSPMVNMRNITHLGIIPLPRQVTGLHHAMP